MTGYYDVHSHFLCGVDDGASDLEETRQLLMCAYAQGVRHIFVTPHLRKGMFEASEKKILQSYEQAKLAAGKIAPDLRVFLGCELYASVDLAEVLEKEPWRCMGDSNCVLIEFSERWSFRMMKERCYDLISHGYQPIIAHAERYNALREKEEYLEELIAMGNYIQVNAGSILGREGFFIKRFCKKILKNGQVHFIGSDGHDLRKRRPELGACAAYLEKILGVTETKRLLIDNPHERIRRRD